MPNFLVTIHRHDNYDPSLEDAAMGRAIDQLNDEMVAAGIRVFVGGLHHASTARSIHRHTDGTTTVNTGSYLKTPEHIGGLWVLSAANLEDAVAWGEKAARACRASVEVREFHGRPARAET